MSIKNKDGTVFKISGPNPLMDEQIFWGKFIKHNFEWTEEIDKENKNLILEEEPKEEEPKEEHKIEIKEEPKIEIKNKKKIPDHKSLQCFCLPAKVTEKKDNLYEETYQRIEFLEKFTFELFLIEKEDIYIKFWTTEKITKNSIVYPKNKDKRWWKVAERTDSSTGFIYMAIISDYTPSFE